MRIFVLAFVAAVSGCAFGKAEITIPALPAPEIKSSVSPDFKRSKYRSILVVIPDSSPLTQVTASGGDPTQPPRGDGPLDSAAPHPSMTLTRSEDYDFIVHQAERILLERGFSVISQDIVARLDNVKSKRFGKNLPARPGNPTQSALLLGKKTNADAILVISHVGAWPREVDFLFDADEFEFRNLPRPQEAEGIWVSYGLWDVSVEAKIIDIKTGEVVWIGGGHMDSRHLFDNDWHGVLHIRGEDVYAEYENFRIDDFNTYSALYRQAAILMDRVLATIP